MHASDKAVTLVVVAGLPGSGKSTLAQALARELGCCLLELDRIEAPILRRISGDALGWSGYEILTSLAEDHLALGHSVILDCVCWVRPLRSQWTELARQHQAEFKPIEVVCSDEQLYRQRVATRRRSARGLKDIDWQRVTEARGLYEPWDTPRLALDSARPIAELIRDAAAYVRG